MKDAEWEEKKIELGTFIKSSDKLRGRLMELGEDIEGIGDKN